ncbi:unnamed protein product [Taenia asiatica]|uniref:Sensitive to high expression protein 9, mitochondrial n=1 Tax=Taenia asiatica TaxID=60517 RepID=A0A0R3VXQ2_TAEAS|nr:unnamed protein product [Taenia asiatica]
MAWVIRTENGGLLNVLFHMVSLSTDHDLEFDLISEVDAPTVEFFRKMLPVLQVMPRSLGGSQAAVNNAHANPNCGPHIFRTTVFAFLLSIVLIILLQPHNSMNALQMALLRSKFTNKKFILRVVHIEVLILTLVFLATSILLLMVYLSSTGLIVPYLETNQQPSVGSQAPVSLPDGLRATVVLASSFVGKGISSDRTLTNTMLHDSLHQAYATIANITSPFSSTKLHSKLITPYIKGLNQTIANLSTSIQKVRGSINQLRNSTNDVLDSLKSRLHLTRILEQIKVFWDDAQSRADNLLKQLNDTVNSVETQIRKYVHDIRIGYFVVGGVFMENALMCFDAGEGCIYVERRNAVRMSDFVVNSYVARQWKPFISSAVGRSADFLNASPPRNIIHVLTQTCSGEASQHPVGLLPVLGNHNLIDVSKPVNSPVSATMSLSAMLAVMEQVRGLNVSGSLPNGAKTKELRRELNGKIAKFSLAELIRDINPAITITSVLEQILEDMKNFTAYADVTNWNFSKPNEVIAKALEPVRKIKSAANMKDYMKVDAGEAFMKLTASLFPCQEAHTEYSAAIGVTCGETGGVHLLIGVPYVLALNILFLTFLYFAPSILAFFQTLQIRMLSDMAKGDDNDSISKC